MQSDSLCRERCIIVLTKMDAEYVQQTEWILEIRVDLNKWIEEKLQKIDVREVALSSLLSSRLIIKNHYFLPIFIYCFTYYLLVFFC